MGLATDAIDRPGLPSEQAGSVIDSIPIAYAGTHVLGTIGSAIVIARLGPRRLRLDLARACTDCREKQGGTRELGHAGSPWNS